MSESPVSAAGATSAGATSAGTSAPERRLTTGRILRLAFLALAVALGGYGVAHRWTQVRAALADIGPLTAAGSLLAVLAGLAATMQVWRGLLGASGSPLPLRAAARIFFVGQLGKYIPGSIWPIIAQMDLASAYRVPRRRSATVAVLTMLISLCAGLVVAVSVLPVLAGPATGGYRWTLLATPVLLACLHPRVVNPVLGWLLRLGGRPALERPLTGRAIAAAFGWALLSWVLLGIHIWLLAIRLGAPSARALALAVGGFAFAWAAGFLTVIAPAGAGVRDVLLVAVLGPTLTVGRAIAVTVVSRILMTLGDLLLAFLSGWTGRRRAQPRT